jgi:signal transduction histidine kinase
MRQEREKAINLVQALGGAVTQMKREYGSTVSFAHNVDRLDVGASGAHEIIMTVREALYNSIQHSGTDHVQLDVQGSEEGNLIISVTDHGCGFPADKTFLEKEGHYGIVGMRERIQRLGGRFDLSSEPGSGTTVRFVLSRSKGRMRAQRS